MEEREGRRERGAGEEEKAEKEHEIKERGKRIGESY